MIVEHIGLDTSSGKLKKKFFKKVLTHSKMCGTI